MYHSDLTRSANDYEPLDPEAPYEHSWLGLRKEKLQLVFIPVASRI